MPFYRLQPFILFSQPSIWRLQPRQCFIKEQTTACISRHLKEAATGSDASQLQAVFVSVESSGDYQECGAGGAVCGGHGREHQRPAVDGIPMLSAGIQLVPVLEAFPPAAWGRCRRE